MKIRELIQQLLREDMDDEICIECDAPYYENGMHIDGITTQRHLPNKVLIVPELGLTQTSTID